MEKILITPRSITRKGWHPALAALKEANFEIRFSAPGEIPSEKELKDLLKDCVGYLAGVEKISENMLLSAPKLKVISRNGVGTDNIDLIATQKLGITVCNTPGEPARSVAELAFGLMISLARSIPHLNAAIKKEAWEREIGIELYGKTLGVVGCGRIGRELSLMALAFGMKVLAYDPVIDVFFTYSPEFRYATLADVFTCADFVSLHCPPQPDGTPLINSVAIEAFKKGAFLINTARAELISEPAVLNALNAGTLAGYATDVFETEPPVVNELYLHHQVILSPHIGGSTIESVDRSMRKAVHNLLTHLPLEH